VLRSTYGDMLQRRDDTWREIRVAASSQNYAALTAACDALTSCLKEFNAFELRWTLDGPIDEPILDRDGRPFECQRQRAGAGE